MALRAPCHQIQIEKKVVIAEHLSPQVFPHPVEVGKIGPAVAGANPTTTRRV